METCMRLSDEELRDVLARAEEIQRTDRSGDEWNAEVAAVVGAAEEVGLSRQAVERALNERLKLFAAPPVAGTLVWAQSADGKFYVAEVVSTSNEGARVRYLRGAEHQVTIDQLRPCAFIPGERVTCHWPWWGPWTCTVMSYDRAKQRVKLSDGWGDSKNFSVSEVWLAPPKARSAAGRTRVYLTLMGVGASIGALIGSIVTALVVR
jgi:hypothetical protein